MAGRAKSPMVEATLAMILGALLLLGSTCPALAGQAAFKQRSSKENHILTNLRATTILIGLSAMQSYLAFKQ